jgi:hypothetical protein
MSPTAKPSGPRRIQSAGIAFRGDRQGTRVVSRHVIEGAPARHTGLLLVNHSVVFQPNEITAGWNGRRDPETHCRT